MLGPASILEIIAAQITHFTDEETETQGNYMNYSPSVKEPLSLLIAVQPTFQSLMKTFS